MEKTKRKVRGELNEFFEKRDELFKKYDWVGVFLFEGMAAVERGRKWGFVDEEGKLVIPLKYDDVDYFQEGLARVKLNEKYGHINAKGKAVIPIEYDNAGSFYQGRARVGLMRRIEAEDGKYEDKILEGHINQSNTTVWAISSGGLLKCIPANFVTISSWVLAGSG
jgi:hypothetical protein